MESSELYSKLTLSSLELVVTKSHPLTNDWTLDKLLEFDCITKSCQVEFFTSCKYFFNPKFEFQTLCDL